MNIVKKRLAFSLYEKQKLKKEEIEQTLLDLAQKLQAAYDKYDNDNGEAYQLRLKIDDEIIKAVRMGLVSDIKELYDFLKDETGLNLY